MNNVTRIAALSEAMPEAFRKLVDELGAAMGGKVSVMVLAVPLEDAMRGHSQAVLWANVSPVNRMIMIEGAREMTRLELDEPKGGKS